MKKYLYVIEICFALLVLLTFEISCASRNRMSSVNIDQKYPIINTLYPYENIIKYFSNKSMADKLSYYIPKSQSLSLEGKTAKVGDRLAELVKSLIYFNEHKVVEELEKKSNYERKLVYWLALSSSSVNDHDSLLILNRAYQRQKKPLSIETIMAFVGLKETHGKLVEFALDKKESGILRYRAIQLLGIFANDKVINKIKTLSEDNSSVTTASAKNITSISELVNSILVDRGLK